MRKTIKDYKKEIIELKEKIKILNDSVWERSCRIGDLNKENTQLQGEIKKLEESSLFNECQFTRKCRELELLEAQLKATRQAISLFVGTTKVECGEIKDKIL